MKYIGLTRDTTAAPFHMPRVEFEYECEDGVVSVLITYVKHYPVEDGYAPEGKNTLAEWDVAINVGGDYTAAGHQLLRHAAAINEAVAHHYAAGHPELVLKPE